MEEDNKRKRDFGLQNLQNFEINLHELIQHKNETLKKIKFTKEASHFRRTMNYFFERSAYRYFMLLIVTMNAVCLVVQAWKHVEVKYRSLFGIAESFFVSIYIAELAVKLYVLRVQYFDSGANMLDFFIVSNAMIETTLYIIQIRVGRTSKAVFNFFCFVKSLRALRILRLIRYMKNVQVVLITCLQSLKALRSIVTLMTLFGFIFAVIGNAFFSLLDHSRFGTFTKSCLTLLKVITLDDWYEIFTDINKKEGSFNTSLIFYLLFYILLEYFTLLSLFIAVLAENFQITIKKKRSQDDSKKRLQKNELTENGNEQNISIKESNLSSDTHDNENSAVLRRSYLKNFAEKRNGKLLNGENHGYKNKMINKDPEIARTSAAIFQILPLLERSYHLYNNHSACNERIINYIIDDLEDIPSI